MECKPRHNTTDVATLYWAGMPGNAGDFPSEESFYTFIEPALCFFTEETNYHNSPSPFGIKMADRLTGKPIHLDISDFLGVSLRVGLSAVSFAPLRYTKGCRFYPSRESSVSRSPGFPKLLTFTAKEISKKFIKALTEVKL